jgi:hypothetical protein
MIRLAALLLLGASLGAQAQEGEIQRALVERDQQSAAFAASTPSAAQAELSQRQLLDVITIQLPSELRPWQRQRMAEERALALPPPEVKAPLKGDPLPLPGGPGRGVDPVLPQGLPY